MPEGSTEPRLSVVIPTRDRPDALADTLAALDAQRIDPTDVEVVVVDNGPGGAIAAGLRARTGRLPMQILTEPTPGPAAARNTGVRAARGPVILLLGDDMRPAGEDLLARHVALHAAQPDVWHAVLGAVTWRPDRPITPFMEWLEHGGPQFDFDSLAPGPVRAARSFYTSHVSLKAAALEHIGGFDERFPFAAVEDVEIGLRLERAGLRLVYHPELMVHHDHHYEPAGFEGRQERVGASARLMHDLHGDHGLLPGPRWTWPLHRALLPLARALAALPLPDRARAPLWDELAMAAYVRGWARAERLVSPSGGAEPTGTSSPSRDRPAARR